LSQLQYRFGASGWWAPLLIPGSRIGMLTRSGHDTAEHGMPSMLEIATAANKAARRKSHRVTGHHDLRPAESASPDALARVIEVDIIPRLLVAHKNGISSAPPITPAAVPVDFLERFAAATLTEEVAPLMARIEALTLGGVDIDTIYLQLLAPAARQLGGWWDQDQCDFVDVTMGLWRLQEIVHTLSALVPGAAPLAGLERRALFSPAPGEQHGLGALIVEEFFRRAGWHTWSAPAIDEDELVALAAGRSFDLIGLTVSVERHVAPLARSIAGVRQASRNPDVIILVGGSVFTNHPELAAQIGADGTAADGNLAVQLAEQLLGGRAGTDHLAALAGSAPPSH
jgi:methanogenic corrinoid protein MtbC1